MKQFARTDSALGDASAVTFADIILNGGGIGDADISTELPYSDPPIV